MEALKLPVVPVCLCSLCCFLTIFAIIALPLSFKSLSQGRYALPFSWHTQEVDSDVVTEPGMYMVGLGNMFIEYPSTFQTMYFVNDQTGIKKKNTNEEGSEEENEEDPNEPIIRGPIRARSFDGLPMHVALSFQWQLKPESLHPLYKILGGGTFEESLYRDEFVRFARAAVVESCAKFTADFFFTNRVNITKVITEHIKEAFSHPEFGLDLEIRGLQLREVDLPDQYDQEIIRTQEQMQEVQVALAERQEQKIVEETRLMVAEYRKMQARQEALAVAERIRKLNEAEVKQLLLREGLQADANKDIMQKLWQSPDPWARFFDMMEIHALNSHNDSRLLINL